LLTLELGRHSAVAVDRQHDRPDSEGDQHCPRDDAADAEDASPIHGTPTYANLRADTSPPPYDRIDRMPGVSAGGRYGGRFPRRSARTYPRPLPRLRH